MQKGNPSRVLTYENAIQVWLMSWDGLYQHRIAAHFDVNQGRVNEVLNHKRQIGSYDDALKRRGMAA